MAVNKEELYKIIEKIPTEKYEELKEYLWELTLPEEELSEEEQKEIDEAIERMDNGEFVTLDELYREVYGDENEDV